MHCSSPLQKRSLLCRHSQNLLPSLQQFLLSLAVTSASSGKHGSSVRHKPAPSDSLHENYEEFEEAVIQAAEECRKVLRDKDAEDLSNLAHRMIKKALGEICVVYEADGKQVDVTFDVDIPNLIYTYLAEYIEIEIKHSKPSI